MKNFVAMSAVHYGYEAAQFVVFLLMVLLFSIWVGVREERK